MVQHIVYACESITEADAIVASLAKTTSSVSKAGLARGYTMDEVCEGWLRCAVHYREQEALAEGKLPASRGEEISDSEGEYCEPAAPASGRSGQRIAHVRQVKRGHGRSRKGGVGRCGKVRFIE